MIDDSRGRFSGINGTIQAVRALEQDYVTFYVMNFDTAVAEISAPIAWTNLSSFRVAEHTLFYHRLPNVLRTLYPIPLEEERVAESIFSGREARR